MSMISSLIDELNKSADEWNSSNMFELARMCREAADTIWELQAENAKLRELVRELYDELDAATQYDAGGGRGVVYEFANRMFELGVEVEA